MVTLSIVFASEGKPMGVMTLTNRSFQDTAVHLNSAASDRQSSAPGLLLRPCAMRTAQRPSAGAATVCTHLCLEHRARSAC